MMDSTASDRFVRQPQRLTRQDFALYRGWLDGIVIEQLHATYGAQGDVRRTRARLDYLRDALSFAARRAQDPAAARLLRLKPGSLTTRVAASDDPPAEAPPSLEDYRASVDPDGFYSEGELLERYAADYPPVDARSGRRQARHRRLRERQVSALARLEASLAESPRADHALAGWFEPALADRLNRAGVGTLGELIARIERDGHRWFARIPKIGATAAARVTQWLAVNAASLRHELSERSVTPRRQWQAGSGSARREGIAPLEALVLPAALDGSSGVNRVPRAAGSPAFDDDLAAIQAWLAARAANAHTARAYRREAERCVLWAAFERCIAFSSLTVDDARFYLDQFLGDPLPSERWVNARRVERHDPTWRPFQGPLSASSREVARSILTAFCQWLVGERYLQVNPFDGLAVVRSAPHGRPAPQTLTEPLWQLVLFGCAAARVSVNDHRDYCALLLAHATGLHRSELAAATLGCLQHAGGEIHFRVRSREGDRLVAISGLAVDALAGYFSARGVPADPEARNPDLPLFTSGRPGSAGDQHLSAHGMSHVFKQIFQRAADRIRSHSPDDAAQLLTASARWLRHARTSAVTARPSTQTSD